MEALANLGIDWKLFLAQAVNFLILLFILKRYAYKPMLAFLTERADRIEKGLKDAEEAKKKLTEMEKKEKQTIALAREEARDIITAAEAAAKKRDGTMLSETKAKIDKMIAEADQALSDKQAKLIREAKEEIVSVVALATEKVLGEKVDAEKEKTLIERALHMTAK